MDAWTVDGDEVAMVYEIYETMPLVARVARQALFYGRSELIPWQTGLLSIVAG